MEPAGQANAVLFADVQALIDAKMRKTPSVRAAQLMLQCAQQADARQKRLEDRYALFTRWAQPAAEPSDDGTARMDALLVHAHDVVADLAALDTLHAELEAAVAAAGRDLAALKLADALSKMRLHQAHDVAMCLLLLCWGYQSAALRAGQPALVYAHVAEHISVSIRKSDWRIVGVTVGLLSTCLVAHLAALRLQPPPNDTHTQKVLAFARALLDMLRRCPTQRTGEAHTAVSATLTVAVDALAHAVHALAGAIADPADGAVPSDAMPMIVAYVETHLTDGMAGATFAAEAEQTPK